MRCGSRDVKRAGSCWRDLEKGSFRCWIQLPATRAQPQMRPNALWRRQLAPRAQMRRRRRMRVRFSPLRLRGLRSATPGLHHHRSPRPRRLSPALAHSAPLVQGGPRSTRSRSLGHKAMMLRLRAAHHDGAGAVAGGRAPREGAMVLPTAPSQSPLRVQRTHREGPGKVGCQPSEPRTQTSPRLSTSRAKLRTLPPRRPGRVGTAVVARSAGTSCACTWNQELPRSLCSRGVL